MKVLMAHGSGGVILFVRPKRMQKVATEPMVPGPSFIHPGFLECLRHPWPFDWRLGEGFRWRPPFFIREKRWRFSASCLKWRGGGGSKAVKKGLGALINL
jgi:hypothetical protein